MEDLKWYVLKAVSGQENKVKSYIETEVRRLGYEFCYSSSDSYGEGSTDEKWKKGLQGKTILSRISYGGS